MCSCVRMRCVGKWRSRSGFDFPMLVSEVLRHDCNLFALADFLFVDTLDVLRTYGGALAVSDCCFKLQCLSRCCNCTEGRAHRALEDTMTLRAVMEQICVRTDRLLSDILLPFSRGIDIEATLLNRMWVG